MDCKIFEPPFHFEEYIEKRLRDISDLNERKAAKAVLVDCLLKGIEQAERNYQNLETRIYHEIENEEKKYAIYMTAIKRQDYDEIGTTFSSMRPEDLVKPSIDLQALSDNVTEGKPYPLLTVYLEQERSFCKKVEQEGKIYQGRLVTDKNSYQAQFRLRRDSFYHRTVEHLYHLFLDNGVPWTTVHCGYLDKFFVIELVQATPLPSPKETFQELQIDLEELGRFVQYDTLPVWNVETILYNSADFIMPCIDGIHFEHEFPIQAYGTENGFLIEKEEEIVEIRREEGKICIITPEETFDKWKAYRVVSKGGKMPYGYGNDVLHNVKQDSFTKRYIDRLGVNLQTKAEIFRRVHEFELERYVRFLGVELIQGPGPAEGILGEMNWFIQDELLDREGQRTLLFKFREGTEKTCFMEDTVNFLVSELQRCFGEYRCVGIIVKQQDSCPRGQ